jgi:GTP-binding protein YchF
MLKYTKYESCIGMKIALIGYPNSGKKTLFELLTGETANGKWSNHPNEAIPGMVKIRDQRLDKLASIYNPQKVTPSTMEFVLTPDTLLNSENSETGTMDSFFHILHQMDVLVFVIRDFENDSVFHIKGSIDPIRDILSMNNELIIQDLIFIEKRIERLTKDLRVKQIPEKVKELGLSKRLLYHLENEKPLRSFEFTKEEAKMIKSYPFLTVKPILIILNVDERQLSDQNNLEKIKSEFSDQRFYLVQLSAQIELELDQLHSEERYEFLRELGIEQPALEKLTQTAYQMLGLISYFTVGQDEVRSWMVRKNSTASQSARAIHADIERGFIRAELMKYDHLIELGNEYKVKEAGCFYLKGRDYLVEDGDILSFRFNV